MDNIQIGRLIYDKRKELGLTQAELAERLQITNKAVSKWENGDGMPDVNLLTPLAKELGLTVDELLNGEEKCPVAEFQNIEKADVYESPLCKNTFDTDLKDIVIGIILCSFALLRCLTAFSSMVSIFAHGVISANVYTTNFWQQTSYGFRNIYYIVFWIMVFAVFVCRLLRIQNVKTPRSKGIAIATFIISIPMLFIQITDYYISVDIIQFTDNYILNFGCVFFVAALLVSEFHGYKLPYKICYGLVILITAFIGIRSLYDGLNYLYFDGYAKMLSVWSIILGILRSFAFYVLYGVFEKRCDEYEREID